MLKNGVLYVFSSNAAPFEQNKAYSPFGVFARLEHAGAYRKAAAALHQQGYGKKDDAIGVDLSNILNTSRDKEIAASNILTPNNLFNFNVGDDPNTLLGNRWLCRVGACLVVGQTGIKKSSFSMQAMISWALGDSLFGITPTRPLRSLRASNKTSCEADAQRRASGARKSNEAISKEDIACEADEGRAARRKQMRARPFC